MSLKELQEHTERKVVMEVCPLQHFYDAEEYHQKYLDKNPGGYCHVPFEEIRRVADIDPQHMSNVVNFHTT